MERQAFLERLRSRLSSAQQDGAAAAALGAPDRAVSAGEDCTELFVERLRELGVEVGVVASLDAAREALERLVGERGWSSVACAPSLRWQGIAGKWTVEARDAAFGLCAADWAVAETGSVVVSSSAEVRRGYSLLPPAVGFFVTRLHIVATVGDVLRALPTGAQALPADAQAPPSDVQAPHTDTQALPSCVSFISGPSSTADLAAIHVVGVHGPGEVFVWVIEEASDADARAPHEAAGLAG